MDLNYNHPLIEIKIYNLTQIYLKNIARRPRAALNSNRRVQ